METASFRDDREQDVRSHLNTTQGLAEQADIISQEGAGAYHDVAGKIEKTETSIQESYEKLGNQLKDLITALGAGRPQELADLRNTSSEEVRTHIDAIVGKIYPHLTDKTPFRLVVKTAEGSVVVDAKMPAEYSGENIEIVEYIVE